MSPTGDLNISTKSDLRTNMVYRAIKDHQFGLRSALNDDVSPAMFKGGHIYTTWRVRKISSRKHGSSRHGGVKRDEETEEDGRRDRRDSGTKSVRAQARDATSALIGEIEAAINSVDKTPTGATEAPDKSTPGIKKKSTHVEDSDSDYEATREHVSKGMVDFIFYTPLRVDQPGFRTLAVLDMIELEHIGGRRLPNDFYPSDHVAICADFQFLW